jgi:hypothetical protein
MPSVGFEPAIPTIQPVQTYALTSAVIGIGEEITDSVKNMELPWFMRLFAHINPLTLGFLFRPDELGLLMGKMGSGAGSFVLSTLMHQKTIIMLHLCVYRGLCTVILSTSMP